MPGLVLCTLTAVLAPPVARAQTPGAEIEQIIVTGSRIARRDFESSSPIVTVSPETFARTGSTSVEAVVSKLPQFTPTYTSTSNNPGNGGQGNVQLRGLGLTSTLVLLDGRRLIPGNGTGVVDVNVIPRSLIESVEVVSGGASAVYGSDAIAGVVNFKLKHEFTGLEFDAGWGVTERGDGTEYSAGLTGGLSFAGGRGNVYGYAGYADREAIFQRARGFSQASLGYYGAGNGSYGPDRGFRPEGSPTIPEGRTLFDILPSQAAHDAVFAGYGYPPPTLDVSNYPAYGFNADGTLFTVGDFGNDSQVLNFRGEQDPLLVNDQLYTYNFGPWNYLQLPLQQVSAFGGGSFHLTPDAEVYAQALYADYSADTQLAPTPAQDLYLPLTNPYIPGDLRILLDSRDDPTAPLAIAKRFVELGPRIASYQHDVFQATLGLRGNVFGGWQFDVYAQTGSYDQVETQQGNALRSKIHELTFAPDAGQAACGGLNLFGPDSVSAQCAAYISAGGTNRAGFDQTVAEASLTGSVVTLPAGDLQLAVGAMYKHDRYFYAADPLGSVVLSIDGQVDIQGFEASRDIEGSDHNTDVYIEVLAPLLSDRRGIERLDLGLGYRRSDYASAGGVDAYKAELLYQPIEVLSFRSSFQRAVRAPSVFELYLAPLPVEYFSLDVADPCAAGSPQRNGPDAARVEELCLAQGVPAAVLENFRDRDGAIPGHSGGNPDLEPERAKTLTVGMVFQSRSTSRWLSAMKVSVDWYRIEVDDAITQVSALDYIPLCYDPQTNPSFDPQNELCQYFSRDPTTGEISDARDYYQNIVGHTVSGIDSQLDWRLPLGSGNLGVNWLLSWMDSLETTKFPGLSPVDSVGRVGQNIGASFPEWKSNLSLSYDWTGLSFGVQWRRIDSMRDVNPDHFSGPVNYRVPSFDYFDLFASCLFDQAPLSGLTLRGGVENLTDKDPPLLPDPVAANTDPSQYEVLGRRYYVNLSYRF